MINKQKIMQTKITIRNEAQTCFIDIEGTIGVEREDSVGSSGVATYEAFRREVERITQVAAQHVVVNIRSTGGDVNDALLIYEALRSLDAHVTTRCYGYTASAATIIAQAADEGCREISSNAMYLIHRSLCSIEGNALSLEARIELLKKTDERLAQLYAQHSGGDAAEYAALMAENNGEGRWLTAEETIEMGLADTIIDTIAQGVQLPDTVSEEGGALMPVTPLAAANASSAAKSDVQKQVKRVVHTALGELLRYFFSRLAYHWSDWLDGKSERGEERHQKRHDKRHDKRHAKHGDGNTIPEQPTPEQPASEQPTSAEPSATAGEVKALSANKQSRSAVAFDEGQRRFKSTTLKAVEDPLMNPSYSSSNQQAYIDDAKAFSR